MFKDIIMFVKYPYTAGVIAVIWLGSAALMAIDHDLPVNNIVIINIFISVLIAFVGFGGKKEL